MTATPDETIASALATAAVGQSPVAVHRFRTGSQHYVFEAEFADRDPVVVRIAAERSRALMAGAHQLSGMLRPLGVPLPAVIAAELNHQFPHLVLERFPGADLGDVIQGLSDSSLETVAKQVVRAQSATARTISSGRYGYAVNPADAPPATWSHVLTANLIRSRTRILAADLFDVDAVAVVTALVADARGDLDSLPSIPFLHDTTTKNVIVTRTGQFSGIVDVDDLCFGDPRYAAALTLASLIAFGGPVRYVDAWMQAAGHPDDRIFRLYVALFIVDFMSEHGQAFNGNQPRSSRDDRKRLLQVFAACLDQACR